VVRLANLMGRPSDRSLTRRWRQQWGALDRSRGRFRRTMFVMQIRFSGASTRDWFFVGYLGVRTRRRAPGGGARARRAEASRDLADTELHASLQRSVLTDQDRHPKRMYEWMVRPDVL